MREVGSKCTLAAFLDGFKEKQGQSSCKVVEDFVYSDNGSLIVRLMSFGALRYFVIPANASEEKVGEIQRSSV